MEVEFTGRVRLSLPRGFRVSAESESAVLQSQASLPFVVLGHQILSFSTVGPNLIQPFTCTIPGTASILNTFITELIFLWDFL